MKKILGAVLLATFCQMALAAGVYRYGKGRPTKTWHQSNYFVDWEFSSPAM